MTNKIESEKQEHYFYPTDYCITFHHEGGEVGRLDFNGPKMVFTGDAEQSAHKLFEFVAEIFWGRLKEEYERGLTDGAKHDRP